MDAPTVNAIRTRDERDVSIVGRQRIGDGEAPFLSHRVDFRQHARKRVMLLERGGVGSNLAGQIIEPTVGGCG